VNDLSLAVRFLENVKLKCGSEKTRKLVYPYIIQEVSYKNIFYSDLGDLGTLIKHFFACK